MKKLTKILSVVMAVVMLLCATPIAGLDMPWNIEANAGQLWGHLFGGTSINPDGWRYGDFYYVVSDGEASITGYSDYASGNITIPSTIEGYPVTSITDFWGYSSEVTSLTIPKSVTKIAEDAFSGGAKLTKFTVAANNPSFSNDSYGVLFNKDKSTLIRCPAGKKGSYTVPKSVTNINTYAFLCDDLTYINVDSDNTAYSSDSEGVLFDKNKKTLVAYPTGKSGSYVIPESVTKIAECAFFHCDKLTSVTIPDSVTTIGESAFSDCESLTSVIIPDSVVSIGNSTFEYCTNLTSVTLSNSITNIPENMFSYCGLATVTIPDSVTDIGRDAFWGCDLTSVVIPDSVKNIDSRAFCYNHKLTYLLIGSGVEEIGDKAFCSCDSLTTVVIPANVLNLGSCVFGLCESLTKITVDEDNPYYSSDSEGVLFDKNKKLLICYPSGRSGNYIIPDGVTKIEEDAFFSSLELVSVIIPDSVKIIGDSAFGYCKKLENVVVGKGVKTIEEKAFDFCNSLTDVFYNDTEMHWNNISGKDQFDDETTIHFLSAISFEQSNYIVNYKGSLKVTATPNMETDKKIHYVIGDSTVATIDDEGNITAVGVGTATVTATIEGTDISDTCTITVSYTWWQWIIVIVLFGWLWY